MSENKCCECKYYDRGDVNKGYCHRISRKGEEPDKDGAQAYDNLWVGEDFFCALHEPIEKPA